MSPPEDPSTPDELHDPAVPHHVPEEHGGVADPQEVHTDEHDADADEVENEDEPRLKYTRLTRELGSVYRNGDAVSAALVFGERMVCLLQESSPKGS